VSPLRLLPRDQGFFELFNNLATRMQAAAKLLDQMFAEPQRLDFHVNAIKTVEHEADQITHDIRGRIDKSFVTPIDREDIHRLAQALDNVIDLIDGTARRAAMFRIRETRDPARSLTGLIIRAVDHIQQATLAIRQGKVVEERSRAVKKLEEEGDAIYHEAMGELFDNPMDPIEVMKWKELYDTLERALDECQAVANVLEAISIKNS
jgi:uncharacterized protein Yka (UPF0111/DUF47 family)